MKPWKRIEPTEVTAVGYRTVVSKTFVLNNGKTFDFQTNDVEGREYAGVVALTKDNRVLIARQFRPGPEKIMEEIPGGYVDPEDKGDICAAAARELEEETGYKPGKIIYLGKVYKDCYNNAVWHYCLATDCAPNKQGQALEATEDVEVDIISIKQFLANAREGRMTDPGAVLLAYETLSRLAQAQSK